MKMSLPISLFIYVILLFVVNPLLGQTTPPAQPAPGETTSPPAVTDNPSPEQSQPAPADAAPTDQQQPGEETVYPEGQPYIGIRVDHRTLPALLIKHLGLEEGQGVIIENIQVDSPADKAGLERDDIILAYEGETVTQYDQFMERISESHIGQEVNMMILHLGRRKSVTLKLAAQTDFIDRDDQEDWKYPFRLTGQMERLNPVGDAWRGVNVGIDPTGDFSDYLRSLDTLTYSYRTEDGLENFEVTIDGDPFRNNVEVIVRTDEELFSVRANEINALPPEYQDAARNALHTARASFLRIGPDGPPPARMWLQDPYLYRVPDDEFPASREALMGMSEEIEALQRRIVELERIIEILEYRLQNAGPQPRP